MQKNHIMLVCMVLTIHSILQPTKNIASKKNSATLTAEKQLDTKSTTDSQVTPSNKLDTVVSPSIIQTPENQLNFQLPTASTTISKDQDFDLFSYFLRPINFSKEGITHYFKYTYNHEKYPEYLPYNFSHIIQFLEFGQEQEQTEIYAKSILKLFLQKIKSCDFINSYALITAMPQLADALNPYLEKKEASFLTELQKSLKARFSTIFSTYFSYFQKSPDAFLDALSEQIAKKTNEVQTQQQVDIEQIKKDILRFLETCMNKLIWAPQDAYQAWNSINELAVQAEIFLDKKLLSDIDDLDDICWSLIHRFVYFMEIYAEEIPQEVFIQIVQDIYNENLLLLAIDEQEELITSKKEFLLKKIKIYCPQALPKPTKEYKIFAAQNVMNSIQ